MLVAMSEHVDPVQPVLPERRWRFRRREDLRANEVADGSALPEPVADAEAPDLRERMSGFAAFAAQLLGQPGQKRGLKGGPETLEKARTAYLEAEYSGPGDRRIPTGRITETEA
jgi:hypothetical protein